MILKPLTAQLDDAFTELEHYYGPKSLLVSPETIEEYDAAIATVDTIAAIARRVGRLADAIASEREELRGDFIAELKERGQDPCEVHGIPNRRFI